MQRDFPLSTVYWSQDCVLSMDQETPMGGNEEIVAIESNIEVYYKQFKEFHARNKRIENVVWGVFQKWKNLRINNYFAVNDIKKSFLLHWTSRG